jgi:hypothetical protein
MKIITIVWTSSLTYEPHKYVIVVLLLILKSRKLFFKHHVLDFLKHNITICDAYFNTKINLNLVHRVFLCIYVIPKKIQLLS